MKVTRFNGPRLGSLAGSIGGDPSAPPGAEPTPDCCDVGEAPPDRGADGNAFALQSSTLAFVQTADFRNDNTDATIAVTLAAPPTIGNLLIATYTARTGNATVAATTPAGWTKYVNEFSGDDPDNGTAAIYYKTVDTVDDTLTITKNESVYAHLVVSEFSGNLSLDVHDFADEIAATTSLVTDAVTPTGTNVLLYASFNQSARTATYTWGGSFTELADENVFTSGPSATSGYRLVTGASGSYAASATSTESDSYGWAILAFTAGGTAWSLPAPNAVDGDDATYAGPFSGTDVLRVDLGGPFRIVRSRLRIACENAGSRTYTIKGANAADFSDEVTLASVTFTATGTYTAQDVAFLWATGTSYRYFELSGTSENRRIHTWELFESTPGEIIVENPAGSGALDDLQDVLDDIYDAITTGDFVTVDAGGGEVISTVAASGSTETIDLANGNVHDVTLTDDCTFTFTSPAAGRARSFSLFLRQGAGFPHTATWPGSVVWAGGAPTLSTGSGDVDVLTFVTLDGGTTWYGFATGGGGAAALDDLSDVTLTTPASADRLRFDGSVWRNSPLIWRPAMTFDGTNWLVAVDGSGNAIMTEA